LTSSRGIFDDVLLNLGWETLHQELSVAVWLTRIWA